MSSRLPALAIAVLAFLVVTAGCPYSLPGTSSGPGAKYKDYLTGGGVLLVELDYAPGNRPSQEVVSALKGQLGDITGKTVEVTLTQDLPDRQDSYTYTADELRQLHEDTQDEEDRSGVVVMHGMLVDGRIENDRTAGLAFHAEAWAIAMGTMRDSTCPNSALVCTTGEPKLKWILRAVAVHEAGHLLGLVNITLPMVQDHEDEDHPGHSSNEDSVMWWEIENAPRFSNLLGGGNGQDIPYRFDSNDKQDARALRSG